MKYKYVFWDFNGTIADDVGIALNCVNDMLFRKGRAPITLDDYYTYVENPIIGFYYHILPPEEIDFDEISVQFHSDYARHGEKLHLVAGAKELFERLKAEGVKQYIVTANNLQEVLDFCDKLGITQYMDKILGAEDSLVDSKIDRVKMLFNSLNISSNEAIFVGDTLHDLEAANNIGVDCVLVSYGHQGKRLLSEHNAFCVDSLKEVAEIIFDDRKVDFHTHSTCSDGTMTPTELVNYAKAKGLSAFALTDHDSVDGIKEAKAEAERIGIEIVPGIEFSAAEDTETHIIGLFIDSDNEYLLNTIKRLKESRYRRMEDICSKLRANGMAITYEEAMCVAGSKFVGRAHIAKLMVQKGYCETIRECFDKYIGFNKPCYSEKRELTATESVKAIREAGGLAFLAHLNQTGFDKERLENLLVKLKNAGLTGIEGYYPEYTLQHISDYRALAEKHSLALSGGSDFHGSMKPHIEIGVGTGDLEIPYFILKNMKNIKNRLD